MEGERAGVRKASAHTQSSTFSHIPTQAQQSNRVCNALALLQCVASHPETRSAFLNGELLVHCALSCNLALFLRSLRTTAPTKLHFQLKFSLARRPSPSFPLLTVPLYHTASNRKLGEGLGTRLVQVCIVASLRMKY